MRGKIKWSMREIAEVLRQRQLNQFDCNIGVSGKRGDGKSTFLLKLLNHFKKEGFKQQKHQVYSQSDVVKLLLNQRFSFCWDDEAINSGYKRDFQNKGQQKLIKIITNYRDNYNIYASALPFFYSLDKDLRELIFMHIHIIERGIAVILMPLSDQIHSQDPWDTKTNVKIEEKEYKRLKLNPNGRFRYEKLTTFIGYVYFNDVTEKQKRLYREIKERKRSLIYNEEEKEKEKGFLEKAYELLINGKLTKQGLIQVALMNGTKYTSLNSQLNTYLKDKGHEETVSHFLRGEKEKTIHSRSKAQIKSLVPDIPL